MSNYLVLTIIAEDRAGIVEQVARAISRTAATGWYAGSPGRQICRHSVVEVDAAAQQALQQDLKHWPAMA